MAHFMGSFDEFTRLTCDYQYYKSLINRINPADTPTFIKKILEENFEIDHDLYYIDLNKFQEVLFNESKPTTEFTPLPTTPPANTTLESTTSHTATPLTLQELQSLHISLCKGYAKWLFDRNYNRTTIYNYTKAISNVCKHEYCTFWVDIANNISKLVIDYGPYGENASYGARGNDTVICALLRFKEFLNEQQSNKIG